MFKKCHEWHTHEWRHRDYYYYYYVILRWLRSISIYKMLPGVGGLLAWEGCELNMHNVLCFMRVVARNLFVLSLWFVVTNFQYFHEACNWQTCKQVPVVLFSLILQQTNSHFLYARYFQINVINERNKFINVGGTDEQWLFFCQKWTMASTRVYLAFIYMHARFKCWRCQIDL